jgi:crotonobetainyl-CoA:carnitine CoA-transferase CaiB-like acyl-CoA transferase
MHQLTYPAAWYLNAGDAIGRRPRSGHPSVVPCEVFPTADGHVFVMCVLPKFWQALCDGLGLGHLPGDPRFATPAARLANRDALVALLDGALKAHPTAHWMARLAGQVPLAPVLTLPGALDNPYVQSSGAIAGYDHPSGPLRTVASPIRLDGVRPVPTRAPALGEDTDAVLAEAGLSASEIGDLRAQGVIG